MKKGLYLEGEWQEWQDYVEEISRRSKVNRRRRTKEHHAEPKDRVKE